jgi:hypothetical protein
MGLIKIFSGGEILALALKEKIEEIGVETVMRNNNQANVLPSVQSNDIPVELFIQETDFSKANLVIEKFRMSL